MLPTYLKEEMRFETETEINFCWQTSNYKKKSSKHTGQYNLTNPTNMAWQECKK